MKLIKRLLFIAISYIFISSCNDISNLGNMKVRIPIIPAMSLDDSLKFIEFHSINMGAIRQNHVIYNYAVFDNKSDYFTIFIYELKSKNKFGFEIYPEKGYPVIFSPLQKNSDNKFVCKWNSDSIPDGYYRDTFYVNNSREAVILIEGIVLN